ncbi:MAG: alpha/beta hydrolase [Alphaproteobacteria bacterium]|nr:alpha/beta hydrolase [Alphaproteobacteria bacterium]
MANKIVEDPRIDPRIKELFKDMPPSAGARVESREVLLGAMQAMAANSMLAAMFDDLDVEAVAPSADLSMKRHEIASAPDGNTISVHVIRPEGDEVLPCVYYIHGGGMMMMSAYDPNYQAWGRMIAAQGVVVAMVEFRNSALPNTLPEIAPYPGGLNDCLSGLRWVFDNSASLGIDASRVIVAGESGGGNLTLATGLAMKRDGEIDRINGLYVLCPYIKGQWSDADGGSVVANRGILLDLHFDNGAVAYGIEALQAGDPLAWPAFASEEDLKGLPRVKISVNECDPLRDEGVDFYRRLVRAGVPAQCVEAIGTVHGTEIFHACLDISRDAARDIAGFAKG